jgi:predicted nucleotidyltransferase
MRQRIAQEAARIMVDEGVRDFFAAKRKAAARLGTVDTQNMPRNVEIEEARSEYQRIFKSSTQPQRLRELREAASQAMRLLAGFHPRLVGSVLSGTAGEHSDINLHVFADTPEELVLFLMDANIPFEAGERRLRQSSGASATFPGYRFVAGSEVVDLTVFPLDGLRQAPRSPVDGRPMRRVALGALEELMAQDDVGTAHER